MNQTAVRDQFDCAEVGDYLRLMKPRVMSLAVFTAAVGILVAPNPVHPVLFLASVLFIALGAGAAGALNMWWDADIDGVMKRTRNRPIPAGRIGRESALAFGLWLVGISVGMLALTANFLAAGLLAAAIFYYVVIYSAWLKRLTPENIVIGGAAGALPPVIGWVAATGMIGFEGILMFLLVFLWTPPHFWALALFTDEDYRKAGVPMLPVTHGEHVTRNRILVYVIALVPVSLVVAFTPIGGPVYLVVSLVLGILLLSSAMALRARKAEQARQDRHERERTFFRFSIAYLFLLFLGLAADAGLKAAGLFTFWPIWFGVA